MNATRETALVRACLDLLRLRGCFAWRQNQGGMTASYKGRSRFLRFAGVDGISDIIGLLPRTGRLLAVECKMPGKRPTDAQRGFLDAITAAGGLSLIVHDVIELDAALTVEGVG